MGSSSPLTLLKAKSSHGDLARLPQVALLLVGPGRCRGGGQFYLAIYAALIGGTTVFVFIRALLVALAGLNASTPTFTTA